jgi:hypothetical protein
MKTLPQIQHWVGLASACVFLGLTASQLCAQQGKDPFIKEKGPSAVDGGPAHDESSSLANVLVQVEYIEVPKDNFVEYSRESGIRTDATPLRKDAQSWILEGSASMIETTLISTRSGQRAKVESIGECIYPVDWEKEGIPVSFTTRNLGTTVEVDPIINSDQSAIQLNLACEIVKHLG